jgi:hypothetical protein
MFFHPFIEEVNDTLLVLRKNVQYVLAGEPFNGTFFLYFKKNIGVLDIPVIEIGLFPILNQYGFFYDFGKKDCCIPIEKIPRFQAYPRKQRSKWLPIAG